MGGVHSFRSFGSGPHGYYRGPVRFSGNWNHWHGGHHRHYGYPLFYYGGYGGGYYPYYDDYYYDDYYYPNEEVCYYSRRYRARICPDD
jgi:hypothetical protein